MDFFVKCIMQDTPTSRSMFCVRAQIKIMKVKHSYRVLISEHVARRELLIQIHVTRMKLGMFVHLKDQPGKKAVLVEDVVSDVFSKIEHHFVIEQKLQTARLEAFFRDGKKQSEVVADAPVEVVIVGQFAVAQYFSAKTPSSRIHCMSLTFCPRMNHCTCCQGRCSGCAMFS